MEGEEAKTEGEAEAAPADETNAAAPAEAAPAEETAPAEKVSLSHLWIAGGETFHHCL